MNLKVNSFVHCPHLNSFQDDLVITIVLDVLFEVKTGTIPVYAS
jgi:hypothetical protein